MGQDEDGNIVNNGGNMPPGLNRREKTDKEENPNPPSVPENPGTEDSDDASVNSAQKGTHIYTYDELNRMVTSNIAKTESTYTYDTLGNLVSEKIKNKTTDYQYNELNQLVSRTAQNQSYTYTYDKRGNRIAETGKKETREYVYDETNHLVEGTNWKGDISAYTYNGVDVRINNTQTSHSGSVYSRDYVIDYTSLERDDLMVYAEGDGQLDYVQREVYAGSERIEQFTDRSNGGYERLLYVHEDLMGNTRYYTKTNGQSYAELTYDAWGMPESPNKLLNNDHGNYVYATYTGHIFDTTLDIYFAEARFYDANTRTWLAMDPIKDGDNWYQYCYSNPLKYWDPTGLKGFSIFGCNIGNSYVDLEQLISGIRLVDAVLKVLISESLEGKEPSINNDILDIFEKISGNTLKFLGEALKGLGDGLKHYGPYFQNFGYAGLLAGVTVGAYGLTTGGAIVPLGGTIAIGGAVTAGVGYTAEAVGILLSLIGDSLSNMGDNQISKSQNKNSNNSQTHENGIYEKADYHGSTNSGRKNKAPTDGQSALDNSVPIKDTTKRRVGISEGEIVVFDETKEGIFHGHVRTWDELTDVMKNALRRAGMVTKKGKIID